MRNLHLYLHSDNIFSNIKEVLGCLQQDVFLQRTLVYKMNPRHFEDGFKYCFKKRLVLRKMVDHVKQFGITCVCA